jgi:hypothetical protein
MNEIMSVVEAREIMGVDADKFSDEEIEKLIGDLDFLAGMAIKRFDEKHSATVIG